MDIVPIFIVYSSLKLNTITWLLSFKVTRPMAQICLSKGASVDFVEQLPLEKKRKTSK